MEAMWKAITPQSSDGILSESELANAMKESSLEQIENGFNDDLLQIEGGAIDGSNMNAKHDYHSDEEMRGFNHEDFLREDKGNAACLPGDEGFDEEMGIDSQLVNLISNDMKTEAKGITNHAADHKEPPPFKSGNTSDDCPGEDIVSSFGTNTEDMLLESIEKSIIKSEPEIQSSSEGKALSVTTISASLSINSIDDQSDTNRNGKNVRKDDEGRAANLAQTKNTKQNDMLASNTRVVKGLPKIESNTLLNGHKPLTTTLKTLPPPLRRNSGTDANISVTQNDGSGAINSTQAKKKKPHEKTASSTNKISSPPKTKLKFPAARKLKGAKNDSSSSFSSRRMLFMPSYLRERDKK